MSFAFSAYLMVYIDKKMCYQFSAKIKQLLGLKMFSYVKKFRAKKTE